MADTTDKRRELLERLFATTEELAALDDPAARTITICLQSVLIAQHKHMGWQTGIANPPAVYRAIAADMTVQAEEYERVAPELQPGRRWDAPNVPRGEA